jgi:hypothetical protein
MTQTTASPIAIKQRRPIIKRRINPIDFAYAPDYDDIAAHIAQAPATRLYDLLMALRRAGVDVFDLVPCVLEEMTADA